MKVFRNILIAGWALIVLTVGLAFVFPKGMSHVLSPIASFFHLIPAILLVLTFVFYLLRLYKAGVRRS